MTERDVIRQMFVILKSHVPSPWQDVEFHPGDDSDQLILYTYTDEWVIDSKDLKPALMKERMDES